MVFLSSVLFCRNSSKNNTYQPVQTAIEKKVDSCFEKGTLIGIYRELHRKEAGSEKIEIPKNRIIPLEKPAPSAKNKIIPLKRSQRTDKEDWKKIIAVVEELSKNGEVQISFLSQNVSGKSNSTETAESQTTDEF